MADLTFYSNPNFNKAKVLTNSLIVTEHFGKQHKHILELIRTILADLEEETNRPTCRPVEYTDKKGEKRPAYEFDKDFFMLLIMYMRGKDVMKIKLAFIHQFNKMEQELLRRQETRMIGTTMRKDFTDTIKIINCGENNEFFKWSYKLFTDIVYKKAFGKTCKQLKIEKGITDYQKNLRNYLTAQELNLVQFWEEKLKEIAINKGWIKLPNKEIYKNIKEFLGL